MADRKSVFFEGTSGDDVIDTGAALNVEVKASAGNDIVYIHAANSTANGGDQIYGGDGQDTLFGSDGNDLLYGAGGNDLFYGGNGTNYLYGGGGNDTVRTQGRLGSAHGGKGDDYLQGGAGIDVLYGDDGNNFIWAAAGEIVSGDGLFGGTGYDELDIAGQVGGFNSIDLAAGRADLANGANAFVGGIEKIVTIAGDWKITGTGADEYFAVNFGITNFTGGGGNDYLSGGQMNDTLDGGAGNDTLNGQHGIDRLFGGVGNDMLTTYNYNETFFGEGGDDTLTGTSSANSIDGDAGNDFLYGGDGQDIFHDVAGGDLVFGGAGQDLADFSSSAVSGSFLTMGTGSDTAEFHLGSGNGNIWSDFTATGSDADILAVEGFGYTDLNDMLSSGGQIIQIGPNVLVKFDANNSVTLFNVNAGDLNDSNFIFF